MSRNVLLWVHGLVAAVIGGGAGAVSATIGVMTVDSKDWNMTDWPHAQHMLFLMFVVFTVNAAIAAFAWLSKSPIPPLDDSTAAVVHEQAVQIQASAQKIQDVTEKTEPPKP